MSYRSAILTAVAAGALSLCACDYQGPSVAGYPGLQLKILNYYDGRGWEQGANCINPQMGAITVQRVVEDTPTRLVLELRYWYQSDSFGDNDLFFQPFRCQGWNQRTFVINKSPGGRLDVAGMSGPQRSLR